MTNTALISVPEPVDGTEADILPAPTVPPEAQQAAALVAIELDRIQQAARNVDRIASDPEMIAVWLRNQVSPHTRSSYEYAWNTWQAHSQGRPLADTTLADLQDFQATWAREHKPGSVNTMMSALRSAFAMAHRRGYIRSNPCAEINDLPNPNLSGTTSALSRRILTRTEVARLLEAARPGRDFALYLMLYHTGCRVSEALALRWEDVNLEGLLPTLTVRQGKGGKGRVIRLSERLRETLIELRPQGAAPDGIVFATRTGRPMARNNAWTSLRRAARRAGIDRGISPHWFRHAHASHALDGGAPVQSVKETLGHASLATTSVYVHARHGGDSGLWLD
ncbi:MAG: tyrosine-type recombinase/integrase [Caldilineaceae bacterium SB0666_bin_21]|nr:tyrosine-type recombinase/integrase [Caldilineaceae bacterium SB0666_bin_21]